MSTAPAGWYDDPSMPGQLRWWDGNTWTDKADAAPVGVGLQTENVPFVADPGRNPAPQTESYDGNADELNDLGAWLGGAFRVPFRQFGPLLGIFAVQLAVWPFVWLLIHVGLWDASLDGYGFQGVGVVPIVAAAVVGFVGLLLLILGELAATHNLYSSWVGRPATFGQSMHAGLRTLPRTVGYGLLLVLGGLAVLLLFIGSLFGAGAVLDGAGLQAAEVALPLVAIGGAAFLWVKLGMFGVAAAVAPSGSSPISASWKTSSGFFWGMLGRIVLLGLVTGFIQRISDAIVNGVVFGGPLSSYEFGPEGEMLLDGLEFGTGQFVQFDQFLPNPVLIGSIIVIAGLVYLIVSVFSLAGLVGLYADLGGPNTFGHHRRGRSF